MKAEHASATATLLTFGKKNTAYYTVNDPLNLQTYVGAAAAISAAETAALAATATAAVGITAVAAGEIGRNIQQAKRSKTSGKEDATDKPSWVNKDMVDYNSTPQSNATRMLNDKYGAGGWQKGANKEYNKIVKWITRHLLK